jgi:hypothetical protein
MRKTFGLMIVLAMAATPALAQKVYIDYAHDFDFSTVDTYQFVDTEESNAENSLMHERIVAAIKQELNDNGREVTGDPDLYITYHITTQEKTNYNTTHFGYGGYGAGWYGWGSSMGTSTTTATNYTVGTLIIDAYEPTEKKMVWRGTGTVTVKSKPEKQMKQVDKILKKLGKRWDKILAGQGE